jgi:Protein of unknown function (DUF2630)
VAMNKNDESILSNIDRLVKEEEQLYGKSEITSEDRSRLADLKVHLDQCWDLLRQRRALREFGKDPDEAKVRPAKIVENYEQLRSLNPATGGRRSFPDHRGERSALCRGTLRVRQLALVFLLNGFLGVSTGICVMLGVARLARLSETAGLALDAGTLIYSEQ